MKIDMKYLTIADAQDVVSNGHFLQIHCDGGFVHGMGAAAFVVHAYDPIAVRRAYAYRIVPDAMSIGSVSACLRKPSDKKNDHAHSLLLFHKLVRMFTIERTNK
jgi:hypothetical protein